MCVCVGEGVYSVQWFCPPLPFLGSLLRVLEVAKFEHHMYTEVVVRI